MNKKIILILLLSIPFISLVSAVCTINNDFTIGDDLYICTGECIYQNSSNSSQYLTCDASVRTFFSASYPNGSFIVKSVEMTRNNSVFEYNLSTLFGDHTSVPTGEYKGEFRSYASQGYDDPVDFQFNVIALSSITSASTGGGRSSFPSGDLTGSSSLVDDIRAEIANDLLIYFLIVLGIVLLILGSRKKGRTKIVFPTRR